MDCMRKETVIIYQHSFICIFIIVTTYNMASLQPTETVRELSRTSSDQDSRSPTRTAEIEPQQPPQRKMYHPESFLSQSTGQELPSQGNKQPQNHSNSSSMIFQHSGINLNSGNSNNGHSRAQLAMSGFTPLTLTKTNSQHHIERQSSYLSFQASDRSKLAAYQQNQQLQQQQQPQQSLQMFNSRMSSHTPSSRTPASANTLDGSSPKIPAPTAQLQQPDEHPFVGNPDDDMDFSAFLTSSQPQTANRTQQKLWLQRENVVSINDSETSIGNDSIISNISTRFKYEEVARSYMHVRRTGNPIVDSLKRVERTSITSPTNLKVRPQRTSLDSQIQDTKFKSQDQTDLVQNLWKKSIAANITLPQIKSQPTQKLPNTQSQPVSNSPLHPRKTEASQLAASELFHMGQRSFGSQPNLQRGPNKQFSSSMHN